jgi:hypothetical protein
MYFTLLIGDCCKVITYPEKILKTVAAIKVIYSREYSSEEFIEKIQAIMDMYDSTKSDVEADVIWRSKPRPWIKKYKEELIALSDWLRHQINYNYVQAFDGNQSYDAVIVDVDKNKIFVEITMASDGLLKSKTMDHLNEHGMSPMTFSNKEDFVSHKPDENGIVFLNPYDLSVAYPEDLISEDIDNIVSAFINKNDKIYQSPTILLIHLDNQCDFDVDTLAKVFSRAKDKVGNLKNQFHEVWLIKPSWGNVEKVERLI